MNALCQYEETGRDGELRDYQCSQCGHTRTSHYPPELLKRRCVIGLRDAIEDDITTDSRCTRPASEIKVFLDVCFGGCRYMRRHCTRWSTGSQQKQIQLWVEHVYDGDCDQFSK